MVARRFAVLAEPMRLRLLDSLREAGELSVQELAEALEATHGNVSRHLNLLYAEGIVGRRKEKTRVLYRIADPTVFELCEQVCGGIERQLEAHGAAFAAGRSIDVAATAAMAASCAAGAVAGGAIGGGVPAVLLGRGFAW